MEHEYLAFIVDCSRTGQVALVVCLLQDGKRSLDPEHCGDAAEGSIPELDDCPPGQGNSVPGEETRARIARVKSELAQRMEECVTNKCTKTRFVGS